MALFARFESIFAGSFDDPIIELRQLLVSAGLPDDAAPLRGTVWKILLGVGHTSVDEYAALVSKGPSRCAEKIAKDVNRTLKGDPELEVRAPEDARTRVLNAFVHCSDAQAAATAASKAAAGEHGHHPAPGHKHAKSLFVPASTVTTALAPNHAPSVTGLSGPADLASSVARSDDEAQPLTVSAVAEGGSPGQLKPNAKATSSSVDRSDAMAVDAAPQPAKEDTHKGESREQVSSLTDFDAATATSGVTTTTLSRRRKRDRESLISGGSAKAPATHAQSVS